MSSGAKRRCALGVHCVINALRARDDSCDDWTEVQESDYTQSVKDLLLKAEGGAGDTLLAEDVRRELDYLAALDGGRYRRVVMLVPVRNVLSYILSYMSPFFSGACHFLWGHIPSLQRVSFFLFVARGASHSWGTAGWWSTGVAAHRFWRG